MTKKCKGQSKALSRLSCTKIVCTETLHLSYPFVAKIRCQIKTYNDGLIPLMPSSSSSTGSLPSTPTFSRHLGVKKRCLPPHGHLISDDQRRWHGDGTVSFTVSDRSSTTPWKHGEPWGFTMWLAIFMLRDASNVHQYIIRVSYVYMCIYIYTHTHFSHTYILNTYPYHITHTHTATT